MMRPSTAHLVRDQRGAISILGIFAAALLIGGIYYLVGVNDANHYREHLQDSADAVAWNGAVMHARGMNLVALLNMVKLSAVAITTALLAIMFGAAQTISWIRSNFFRRIRYGWTIPFLIIVFLQALTAYQNVEGKVRDITDAADKAQEALRKDLPEIADQKAMDTAAQGFGAPTRSAFTERPFKELPIEEGTELDFCAQLSRYSDPPGWTSWVRDDSYSVHWPAYAIAYEAFRSVPSGTVRDKARSYAKSMLDPFCIAHGVKARDVQQGAKLGQEPFQLRYYAVGDELPTGAEAGVRTASWGFDDDGGRIRQLRDSAGRFASAQAEFYFDGDEQEAQYLWHMAWRPRLRRLHLEGGSSGFVAGCQAQGDAADCGRLGEVLDALKDAAVH